MSAAPAPNARVRRGHYWTGDDPYFWTFEVPLPAHWAGGTAWHVGRRKTWAEAMAEVDRVRREMWRSI